MVVKSNTVHDGGKELKKDWPITEGLILGTTKIDGREMSLKPQGLPYKNSVIKSSVPSRNRKML